MQQTNRRILIVDDDQDDIDLLKEALLETAPAVHIRMANSGRDAMHLLQEHAAAELPTLIVLDYNMPDMTGAEVLTALGNEPWFGAVTKAVWSTSDSALYEQICRRAGADHYFKKPDNIADIWKLASQLLSI